MHAIPAYMIMRIHRRGLIRFLCLDTMGRGCFLNTMPEFRLREPRRSRTVLVDKTFSVGCPATRQGILVATGTLVGDLKRNAEIAQRSTICADPRGHPEEHRGSTYRTERLEPSPVQERPGMARTRYSSAEAVGNPQAASRFSWGSINSGGQESGQPGYSLTSSTT